jgi:NAD(P) transhydrogenase subunit alpha
MKVAVVKESFPEERRVALTPAEVAPLQKLGCQILVERGAGLTSGFTDEAYAAKGAEIVDHPTARAADVLLGVQWTGAAAAAGQEGGGSFRFRPEQLVIGTCDPLGSPKAIALVASSGALLFGLEMIPRITRAQSMDVLSSMATVAGYRAVLLAAIELPQMFPLMMTAAGTLTPARAFVIGAGVAGLQAIATARRLGAVVQAYDVRPAVREQCESLGAKFVELPLETTGAEGQGGYAQAMGEDFYRRQRELMARVVAESDVVITTAAIPGEPSPLLITADAVAAMQPGSVIVDLAAERGGNCELSQPDTRVIAHGVTILGPTNLPSQVPRHASQMYARNIATFLKHLIKDRRIQLDLADPITRETLLTRDGQVIHPRLRELLELPALPPPADEPIRGAPSSSSSSATSP